MIFIEFLLNFCGISKKREDPLTGLHGRIFVFQRKKEGWGLGHCLISLRLYLPSCGGNFGLLIHCGLTICGTSIARGIGHKQ